MKALKRAKPDEVLPAEREVLAVIDEMTRVWVARTGDFATAVFTRSEVEYVIGRPVPGTLATLAIRGLTLQRMGHDGHAIYQITLRGTALARARSTRGIVVPR